MLLFIIRPDSTSNYSYMMVSGGIGEKKVRTDDDNKIMVIADTVVARLQKLAKDKWTPRKTGKLPKYDPAVIATILEELTAARNRPQLADAFKALEETKCLQKYVPRVRESSLTDVVCSY